MYIVSWNINKALKLTKVNIKSGGVYMQNNTEKKWLMIRSNTCY